MYKDTPNSTTNQVNTLFSFDNVFRDKKIKVYFEYEITSDSSRFNTNRDCFFISDNGKVLQPTMLKIKDL